mmetsp:Transcript_2757/g.6593  ORF Transcript_2757/g.6593 Transcript_2757/m.6593 type:complete len:220 (+) Transcript_2757:1313-1972(+)
MRRDTVSKRRHVLHRICRRPSIRRPAAREDNDAVRHSHQHLGGLMDGERHRCALHPGDATKSLDDCSGRRRVEPARRLVEKENPRFRHQLNSDREPALLPTGQPPNEGIAHPRPRRLLESQNPQRLGGSGARLGAVGGVEESGIEERLLCSEHRHEHILLLNIPRHRAELPRLERLPVHFGGTGEVATVHSVGKGIQERCLARTGRPHDKCHRRRGEDP